MMTAEQAKRLREAFPPSAIGHLPKAGLMLDYVGHAATTDRLLQVDPDWSWEPFALDESGLPALDGEGNLWIKLTVCGVTRPGVGDGKTAKERIGDAIRNAAMRFGVALDLWAKEDLQANGAGDTAEAVSLLERQKARIRAREAEIGHSPDFSFSMQEPGPEAPSPAQAPPREEKLLTRAQASKLGVLIGWLRDEQGAISTEQLYAWIAKHRNVDAAVMTDLLPDAYTSDGVLHWGPLQKTLVRPEANALINALVAKYGEKPE